MKPKENRAATLSAVITQALPRDVHPVTISHMVASIQRATRSAKAAETKACNVPVSEAQALRDAKAQLTAEIAFADMVTQQGGNPARLYIRLGGDCRGNCGFLHSLDSPFEGDGWARDWPIW